MASGAGDLSSRAPDSRSNAEFQQGMDDYRAGDFKAAARHFGIVTVERNQDAQAFYMLGMAKAGAGDLRGAEKSLIKSVTLDPASVLPHRDLAITEGRLNENDKARAELETLASRETACAGACPEAADLRAAISAVQLALGVVSPSAALPLHGDYKFANLSRERLFA